MELYDRRHSHGTFLPNIYFILQLIGIALILNASIQVSPMYTSYQTIIYPLIVFAFMAIGYCVVKRNIIVNRQF